MDDAFYAAISHSGLGWLIFAAGIAGIVRGFSGFGTALIFIPIAGQFLPPLWVFITLVTMDVVGPIPVIPRAVRDADRPSLVALLIGMVVALPIGLWALSQLDPIVFRYIVSTIAILVPILILLGVSYRGAHTRGLLVTTGTISGFLGGVAGLPGPPVILLYAASKTKAAIMRANTLVYLFCFDLALLALLFVRGDLQLEPLMIGAILIAPTMIGNLIGARIFDPSKEKLYRTVAYIITFAAAISGLPIWD